MRAFLVVFLSVGLVAAAQGPASAGSTHRLTGPASDAVAVNLGADGFCPQNPFFPEEGEEPHTRIVATIERPGPDLGFQLDACWVFTGALGGRTFEGTYRLSGPEGSVTGSVAFGSQSAAPNSPVAARLTVDAGTGAFRDRPRGIELFFEGCSDVVLFFEGPGTFPLSPAVLATEAPSPSLPCDAS
jgi:hypothetical protein